MKFPDRDLLHQRGRALEKAFFAERDQQLLEKLRRRLTSEEAKKLLAAATGVKDEIAIPELANLDVPQFLAVLGIFPLVEVAWCDRKIPDREREAILAAAHDIGVCDDTPCYELLGRWLEHPPHEDALKLWTDYVQAVCATLEPETVETLKQGVIDRAKKIAEAAGGIFGMGNKISAAEEACLTRLEDAFCPPAKQG